MTDETKPLDPEKVMLPSGGKPVTFLVNLDAKRAQRAEADGNRYAVQLGSEIFVVPGVDEWPVELGDHLDKGDLAGALRTLLAPEDSERFFSQRPTMNDIAELFEALSKAAGVGDLGNSEASAGS